MVPPRATRHVREYVSVSRAAGFEFRNGETQAGELRGVFGRPRRAIFAKLDFEVAFCGQNIHGQAAVPQGDAKP